MKLLVVEDDAKIAAALRRGLTAEGFQVEVAHDGVDGLWRAREGELRPHPAGHHAAGPQRLPGLRRPPPGRRHDARSSC